MAYSKGGVGTNQRDNGHFWAFPFAINFNLHLFNVSVLTTLLRFLVTNKKIFDRFVIILMGHTLHATIVSPVRDR